jgi:Rrf2 family protein
MRGAQGGYVLAREPSEIKVGDVIRALEGPIARYTVSVKKNPGSCDEADHCITRTVWARVRDGLAQVLDSISLADMCREAEESIKGKALV